MQKFYLFLCNRPHLEDNVGFIDFIRRIYDLCTCFAEFMIREMSSGSSPCLHQNVMAIAHQKPYPVGNQRNPVFHIRNFLGHTNSEFAFFAGHFQHLFLWHEQFGSSMFAEVGAGFFHTAKFYTKLQKKKVILNVSVEKTTPQPSDSPTSSVRTRQIPKILLNQGKNP